MKDMIFDIVGTYFVKTYWNALYNDAVDNFQDPKSVYATLEESYIASIDRYTRAFSRKQNPDEKINREYISIIKDLHTTTRDWLPKVGTIADFVDLVAKQFIHPDYLSAMGHQSEYKTGIFRRVLSQSLAKFSIFITEEEIEIVLEDRDNWEHNLKYWRTKFIEILNGERDKLTKLFLAERHGVKVDIDDHAETVPKEVCLNMQKKIQDLLLRIKELEHTQNKYVDYINKLKDLVTSKDRTLQNIVLQLQQHGIMDAQGQIVYKQPTRRRASPKAPQNSFEASQNSFEAPQNQPQTQIQTQTQNQNQEDEDDGDMDFEMGDDEDMDFAPQNQTQNQNQKVQQVVKMANVVQPLMTAQYSDDDYEDAGEQDPNGVEITGEQTAPDDDNSSYEDMVPDE